MQVKKFEARSMKEALEMVKSQMGPDAIILSARDNNKSFGLVGEGSVEVTAAVSEQTLQKKKFVESRLSGQHLQNFSKSPAKVQKNIIDKVVNKYTEKSQPPKPITSQRYIDIDEPVLEESPRSSAVSAGYQNQTKNTIVASKNSTVAGKNNDFKDEVQRTLAATNLQLQQQSQKEINGKSEAEISHLRQEIVHLREIISQFKNMPQNVVSSHPGLEYGIPYELSDMYQKLTGSGVAGEIAAAMLVKAQENIPALKLKNKNLVEAWLARHILETTPLVTDRSSHKIHCFVGPSGSGKTTAMVKMASELLVNEKKKVALITTDTFKVGAAEQMRTYAQILNVPFAVVKSQADWTSFMKYLSEIDVALVDFPGWSLKSQDEVEKLNQILPPHFANPRMHFVMSATAKDSDIIESTKRYSIVGIDDAIFTGLDLSVQHGNIYNLTQRALLPLHSFSIGSHVPDDFEPATKERVLDLIFKITDEPMKWMELR